MPQSNADAFTQVARPALAGMFVTAQIALAVLWTVGWTDAKDASAMLGPFTMMAVTYWFRSRDDEKAPPKP